MRAHATGIERMFVYPSGKVKETEASRLEFARSSLREMPKREPTTDELRRVQHERTTEEHAAIDSSITPDEERQHRRRAEKSVYLERMLAARERSEREPTGTS